jgi:sec-independent protein translocase protein TatC
VYLGLLGASPYILYELFRFISPALYENERRYSVQVAGIIYVLFLLGVLMSYFVLFPISFRFLGTYSVSAKVVSNITLDSYISTFVSLTLVMGVVFQLPVVAFFLGKLGVVSSWMLSKYRKHALIVIMLVAAIITPPDLMTLILVTIPLYLLYEVSIRVVKWVEPKEQEA